MPNTSIKLNLNQKGIIHLILILILLVVAAVAAYFIFSNGKVPSFTSAPKEPKVALKSEYKNPFEKKSQYVNPFDQYKSPFVNLKK